MNRVAVRRCLAMVWALVCVMPLLAIPVLAQNETQEKRNLTCPEILAIAAPLVEPEAYKMLASLPTEECETEVAGMTRAEIEEMFRTHTFVPEWDQCAHLPKGHCSETTDVEAILQQWMADAQAQTNKTSGFPPHDHHHGHARPQTGERIHLAWRHGKMELDHYVMGVDAEHHEDHFHSARDLQWIKGGISRLH